MNYCPQCMNNCPQCLNYCPHYPQCLNYCPHNPQCLGTISKIAQRASNLLRQCPTKADQIRQTREDGSRPRNR